MNDELIGYLAIALAKRNLRFNYCIDIVNWAILALESGIDSKSLRILAGLSESETEEVDQYLRLALDEQNQPEPDLDFCFRKFVASIARESLDGRKSLRAGCRVLYDIGLALPDQSQTIFGLPVGHLDDAWDLAEQGIGNTADVEKEAMTAMQELLCRSEST